MACGILNGSCALYNAIARLHPQKNVIIVFLGVPLVTSDISRAYTTTKNPTEKTQLKNGTFIRSVSWRQLAMRRRVSGDSCRDFDKDGDEK